MQVKKQLLCSLHHHQAKVTPGYKGAVPVSRVLETRLQGEQNFILVLKAVIRIH